MKVTVIGNWGGFPEAGGATSGYLFQDKGYNLLIDCGSAVLSGLQQHIKIEQLNSVVISHYHFDHIADIGPLQYAVQIKTILNEMNHSLNIYGHSHDVNSFRMLTMVPYIYGVSYDEHDRLNLGPFTISFCRTIHPVACFAMRIESGNKSVVYTGDTSYFEGLSTFSKNADLLICECNFYANQDGSKAGHMNSIDAGRVARDGNVKKLLLTHLPHQGNPLNLVREAGSAYNGPIELAVPGWMWMSE